jgi:hypothetical protein
MGIVQLSELSCMDVRTDASFPCIRPPEAVDAPGLAPPQGEAKPTQPQHSLTHCSFLIAALLRLLAYQGRITLYT